MATEKTSKSKPEVKNNDTKRLPFYRRRAFLWPVGIVLGLIIATLLAFWLSPWPGALLVRTVFNNGNVKTLAALEKHTPNTPITVLSNQQYEQGNNRAMLDVYIPASAKQTNQALPVVIWTHGGAWVSGDKANVAPYFKLLAAQGFTVISLNYTLAPEQSYPTQIYELNAAHAYVKANAKRFHVDQGKIFLAGDSAGSQLSSQMAALATNPNYAKEVGITPSLEPSQLAGVILFCGIYKMEGLRDAAPNLPALIRWGDDETVWAYSGSRDKSNPLIRQMSPYYHVTKNFPATFISGGNSDPLTNDQSIPLADKLTALGVPTTRLFYSADHTPGLPHEYQFNLDTSDGQSALKSVVNFLRTTDSSK